MKKQTHKHIILNNLKISLRNADEYSEKWIGNHRPLHQLTAAWSRVSKQDFPMHPCLTGLSGSGKTQLAVYCARRIYKQKVYIFQCSNLTTSEELTVLPVLGINQKTALQASALVTAMLTGSVCILKEAAQLNEK